jgi:hypothetical protein
VHRLSVSDYSYAVAALRCKMTFFLANGARYRFEGGMLEGFKVRKGRQAEETQHFDKTPAAKGAVIACQANGFAIAAPEQ